MHIMLILCEKRQREALLDELNDWQEEGAQIFLSGITNKASVGFIFLEWGKPIPDTFRLKMREDRDIIDYLVFGKDIIPETVPSQPA